MFKNRNLIRKYLNRDKKIWKTNLNLKENNGSQNKIIEYMKDIVYRKNNNFIYILIKKQNELIKLKYNNMKKIKKETEIDNDSMKNLQKNYVYYILTKKKLDSIKDKGINYFDSSLNNINGNKNNNKINRIIKLFNKEDQEKNNKDLTLIRKNIKQNIIEEHIKNIESKKVSNNLLNPYYFFTAQYNERSMPSQIKHWNSSTYNYIKLGRIENNFLDNYTSKLIKLFFSVKYIKRKLIWSTRLIEGIKVKSTITLMHDINMIIKYTSNRTSLTIKKVKTYTSLLLTLDWVKKQIQHSKIVSKAIRQKKNDFFAGFYPKKKTYIRKLSKVLLSKPLFKHTSFNLSIDLFIYNNKRFKYRKIKNLILRRTSYKYLYSMYTNYFNKIKETINRPRFFYTNLIMPSIYNYYKWVSFYYEFFLIKKKKSLMIYLCLLLLQLNFIKNNNINSNYNNINLNLKKDVNKKKFKNKPKVIFKKLIRKNQNINILYNNVLLRKFYNLDKNLVNKIKLRRSLNENKNKLENRISKFKKSNFLSYKKYMEDLNNKSKNPVNINNLTLWNIEGMGNSYSTPSGSIIKSKIKIKNKNNNISFNNYKEKERQNELIKEILKEKNSYKKKIQKIKKLKAENTKKFMSKFNLLTREELSLFNKKKKIIINQNKIKNNYNYKKKYVSNINELIMNQNTNQKFVNPNTDELLTIVGTNYGNIQNDNIGKNTNLINKTKSSFNKNEYIKELYENNKNIYNINNLFTTFYFNNKSNMDSCKFNLNKKIPAETFTNNNNFLYLFLFKKDIQDKLNNSKVLWNNLDYSIIRILSKYLNIKENELNIQSSHLNFLFSEINKFKKFGNIWYILYFLGIIKKEFYKINKDVLYLKESQVLPYTANLMNTTSYNNNNNDNIIIHYENNNKILDINLWPSFYSNKREEYLNLKMGYNEKLFKSYYRNWIPYFILKSYKQFISYIGIKNWISNLYSNNNIINKINVFKYNNIILYNFITVKILLDLLHYNYRSLIRIKSKYYFINKFRLFSSKLNRLFLNNWITSIRFIRKLRKTPSKYWFRYHKLISYYLKKIIRYSELDTKQKVFVPFIIYFEDILFNIYGKWVLIRLWPIKRYYLSSFILAGRILTLLLWRKKRDAESLNFRKIIFRLISGIKILQIKKAYDYYIVNNSSWPKKLIENMKDKNNSTQLNYNNLEFYNLEEDRYHYLNTYSIVNNQLFNYISTINSKLLIGFNDNINFINNYSTLISKRNTYTSIINKKQFIYNWLRPLKNNIIKLNQYTDISGIKVRIKGRVGLRRNNLRSINKTKYYGNLFGFRHSTLKLTKVKINYSSKLRGFLKSNIDYAIKFSKTMNGTVSFKVWMSSEVSADIHELLLHLIRIKYIYEQLINRYLLVDTKFKIVKYKYGKLNNNIIAK